MEEFLGVSHEAILFASTITVAAGMLWFVARRMVRQKRDTQTYEESVRQQLHIAPTLHPVIDPNTCIGSLSCIKVCPEGDILGIVEGKAALIEASNCIGHGRCELECPVDAIRLVFGSSERGVDLPEIDQFFETSRAGVHVVGELGGMGLIKNAITQGLQVAAHFKKILGRSNEEGTTDVAIIGAGPAGMATALACKEAGLKFRLLEKEEKFGGTIANYPRQKLVMTEKVKLPYLGWFGRPEISKEDLLSTWNKALRAGEVQAHTGIAVTGIQGQDGAFKVVTNKGALRARKVVLAIGRMGTPRKLDVPGEELEKVTYRLIDPEQYNGANVLVVGGGDSALECAIMLAEQSSAKVSVSYRGPAFGRCRPANKEKMDALIARGKIRALMSSNVKAVRPKAVTLDVRGSSVELPNDFVIVQAGGIVPTEYLKQLGIEIKRYFGTERIPTARRPSGSSLDLSRVTQEVVLEEKKRRSMIVGLTVFGILIVGYLTYVGLNYYRLPIAERVRSPLHESLRPGGNWGHGVGIVATLVMLSNFLYPIRKHARWMKGKKSIRNWLTFHMFVGLMSPIVILFHAAFQSNNMVATLSYVSVLLVVSSGIVGRFIYGLIPVEGGRYLEAA